jgi:hypothetical protein
MLSTWFVDGKGKPLSQSTILGATQSTINIMRWSPNGKRLITGDRVCCIELIKYRLFIHLRLFFRKEH